MKETIHEKEKIIENQTEEIAELKELLKEGKEMIENALKENKERYDKYEKLMEENVNKKISQSEALPAQLVWYFII